VNQGELGRTGWNRVGPGGTGGNETDQIDHRAQAHAKTDQNRPKQTETDRNRPKQTETDEHKNDGFAHLPCVRNCIGHGNHNFHVNTRSFVHVDFHCGKQGFCVEKKNHAKKSCENEFLVVQNHFPQRAGVLFVFLSVAPQRNVQLILNSPS